MKNIELDCKGLACPMPVVKTKNCLEENEEVMLNVIVDNDTAKENVKKLANSMNLKVQDKKDGNNFVVSITKTKMDKLNDKDEKEGKVYLIRSNKLGVGEDELGKTIIKGYVYTLTQIKPLPSKVLFVNSGVELTTINEETVANLKILEENGTDIISCGTCLEYYGLKDKVKVGVVGNMYDIVDSLNSRKDVVSV